MNGFGQPLEVVGQQSVSGASVGEDRAGSWDARTQDAPDGSQRLNVPPSLVTTLFILVVLALATVCRLYRLVPIEAGLSYAQDADEGVYATTAQLMLQGYLPYRDFFTPMPPFAIYIFMAVLRLFYHPWGSAVGLMALRYTCALFGLVTVWLTFVTGRLMAGTGAGVLSAAILAVDGIVVAQDRRAMLESPANMLSLLAVLFYLRALKETEYPARRQKLQLVGAGVFCALALLTKGTALVSLVLIGLAILVRTPRSRSLGRWQQGFWFFASFFVAYLTVSAVFLIQCPVDYVKQMYLFHMLRPPDGTAHLLARLAEMSSYPWSWTTVRIALLSIALCTLLAQELRNRDSWLVVAGWAGLVLLLLLTSRTYFATYFSQLAVPLALLGGCVVTDEVWRSFSRYVSSVTGHAATRLQLFLQLAVLVLFVVASRSPLMQQYMATKAALEQTKPAYLEISSHIERIAPIGTPILVFETNYTFLSSRPPAEVHEGSPFVDSYGEMLYRNLGMGIGSIPDLLRAWPRQERVTASAVFHREQAQNEIISAFGKTQYVVFDYRALKQLTSATGGHIRAHSRVLVATRGVELRERLPD